MIHANRDQSLLLLAHGELDVLPSLATRLHLLVCSDCQTRLKQFQMTSSLIASALSTPDRAKRVPTGTTAPILLLVLATMLVLSIAYGLYRTTLAVSHHGGRPVLTGQPCSPGLPNDRCR